MPDQLACLSHLCPWRSLLAFPAKPASGLALAAVDIVQPDICYVGGLTRAMRVAEMAREGGKPCVPHSANLSMVTVFTLHMMGAIPNAGPHVEFSIEQTGRTDELLIEPLVAIDGKVAIPEGPGWGVAVPEAWLQKADRQISES